MNAFRAKRVEAVKLEVDPYPIRNTRTFWNYSVKGRTQQGNGPNNIWNMQIRNKQKCCGWLFLWYLLTIDMFDFWCEDFYSCIRHFLDGVKTMNEIKILHFSEIWRRVYPIMWGNYIIRANEPRQQMYL